jgi:hypothetical protein
MVRTPAPPAGGPGPGIDFSAFTTPSSGGSGGPSALTPVRKDGGERRRRRRLSGLLDEGGEEEEEGTSCADATSSKKYFLRGDKQENKGKTSKAGPITPLRLDRVAASSSSSSSSPPAYTTAAAAVCTPGRACGAKRRLQDMFSPLPIQPTALCHKTPPEGRSGVGVDKNVFSDMPHADVSDGSDASRHRRAGCEDAVTDEAVASAALADNACVLEMLIDARARRGISFIKSWTVGDLKRRLVWLGHFGSVSDIVVRKRFSAELLDDGLSLGDLDAGDTYEATKELFFQGTK